MIDGDKNYLHGLIKNADDFEPLAWKNTYYPRILCGNKGSGKTTLMLFTKAKLENENFILFYIRLASPVGAVTTPWQYIRSKIIQQIELVINDLVIANNEPLDKMVIERYKYWWIPQSLLPDNNDTQREKESKRLERRNFIANRLFRSKHTYEFTTYLRESINYIRNRFKLDVILFVDDVDRLQDEKMAKIVCDRVKALARDLGDVPCVVSAREETLALLSDTDPMFIKISVAPPSFKQVLMKRKNKFMLDFKYENKLSEYGDISTEHIKRDVSIILDSILDDEVYSKLISFHYDLDILLDISICILTSPFITVDYLKRLHNSNEKIPWHVVLDSMQRYRYRNFYDQNSFILNVYDNNQKAPTLHNSLVRIRLLQVLRHEFVGINKPIEVGKIISDMLYLGYNRSEVESALSALASQRLIVTGKLYNYYNNNVSDVIPQSAVVFYLDYLIYSYRYIQNILPVTRLNFSIPMDVANSIEPISGKKLKKTVDPLIYKFIAFIKECENYESEYIKDECIYRDIIREECLSDTLKLKVDQEIHKMKRIKDIHYGGMEYV